MLKHIILIAILTVMVVVAIGYGIHLSGTPSENKSVRYDGIRIQDFSSMRMAIENYYTDNLRMPSSVVDLLSVRSKTGINYLKKEPKDPKTKQSYQYQPVGQTQYKLCAVFETSSDDIAKRKTGITDSLSDISSQTEDNSHPKGQYCFIRTISQYLQQQYNSNQNTKYNAPVSGNTTNPYESTSSAF